MSNFDLNEKIVCVDNKPRIYPFCKLIKGEIYTVIGYHPFDNAVILREIKSDYNSFGAYKSNRFRKLDTDFANEVIKNIIKKENKEPFRELLRELTEPEISK